MIDHFNLPVASLQRSREFYERVLGTLGYPVLMQDGAAVGFGRECWRFGIVQTTGPFPRMHVAFEAPSRAHVDRFFVDALDGGARDNGRPGVRSQYNSNYYAAFVLDPDGHNIEAVCRLAP